jgi:hypothetical protein
MLPSNPKVNEDRIASGEGRSIVAMAQTAVALAEDERVDFDQALDRSGILRSIHDIAGTLLKVGAALPEPQLSTSDVFGSPSVTLAWGARTRLDMNIWFDNETTFHGHSFRGAFGIAHGSAVNLRGRQLDPAFYHHEDFRLGSIRLGNPDEVRGPGSVFPIVTAGDDFHDVLHLTQPTVICVLREHRASQTAFEYFVPGLGLRAIQHHEFTAERARLSLINAAVNAADEPKPSIAAALLKLPRRVLAEYAISPRRFGLRRDEKLHGMTLARFRTEAAEDRVARAVLQALEAKREMQATALDWHGQSLDPLSTIKRKYAPYFDA